MRIESVRLIPYSLALRDPWPTAEGPVTERHGCLLALEDDTGRVGLGDSAPLAGFELETISSSITALRSAARRLLGLSSSSYEEGAAHLPYLAPVAATPAARHAIDLALHDLAAQEAGRSVARHLAGDRALSSVPANVAIPRVDAEHAASLARDAVGAGARTLKLKVGGLSLAEDLARIRAIRDEVGEEVSIRVDANQAWSEEEALEALTALRAYAIEFAEQPVSASDLGALSRLRRDAGVLIAADEAIRDLRSARRILDARAADILILKPMVLGGLHAAREVAALARERGVSVVVTSLIESAVGRTGALHFAASLGPMPYAHGIATGSALQSDVASAPTLRNGALEVPSGPGLGVAVGADLLLSGDVVEAA